MKKKILTLGIALVAMCSLAELPGLYEKVDADTAAVSGLKKKLDVGDKLYAGNTEKMVTNYIAANDALYFTDLKVPLQTSGGVKDMTFDQANQAAADSFDLYRAREKDYFSIPHLPDANALEGVYGLRGDWTYINNPNITGIFPKGNDVWLDAKTDITIKDETTGEEVSTYWFIDPTGKLSGRKQDFHYSVWSNVLNSENGTCTEKTSDYWGNPVTSKWAGLLSKSITIAGPDGGEGVGSVKESIANGVVRLKGGGSTFVDRGPDPKRPYVRAVYACSTPNCTNRTRLNFGDNVKTIRNSTMTIPNSIPGVFYKKKAADAASDTLWWYDYDEPMGGYSPNGDEHLTDKWRTPQPNSAANGLDNTKLPGTNETPTNGTYFGVTELTYVAGCKLPNASWDGYLTNSIGDGCYLELWVDNDVDTPPSYQPDPDGVGWGMKWADKMAGKLRPDFDTIAWYYDPPITDADTEGEVKTASKTVHKGPKCPDYVNAGDTAYAYASSSIPNISDNLYTFGDGKAIIPSQRPKEVINKPDDDGIWHAQFIDENIKFSIRDTIPEGSVDTTTEPGTTIINYKLSELRATEASAMMQVPITIDQSTFDRYNDAQGNFTFSTRVVMEDGKAANVSVYESSTTGTLDMRDYLEKDVNGNVKPQTLKFKVYLEAYRRSNSKESKYISKEIPVTLNITSEQKITWPTANPTSFAYNEPVTLKADVSNDANLIPGDATNDDYLTTEPVTWKLSDPATASYVTVEDLGDGTAKVTPKTGNSFGTEIELTLEKEGTATLLGDTLTQKITVEPAEVDLTPKTLTKKPGDLVPASYEWTVTKSNEDDSLSNSTLELGHDQFANVMAEKGIAIELDGYTPKVNSGVNYFYDMPADGTITMKFTGDLDEDTTKEFYKNYAPTFKTANITMELDTPSNNWVGIDVGTKGENDWYLGDVTLGYTLSGGSKGYSYLQLVKLDGTDPIDASKAEKTIVLNDGFDATQTGIRFYTGKGAVAKYSDILTLPDSVKIDQSAPEVTDVTISDYAEAPATTSIGFLRTITGDHFFKDGMHVEVTASDDASGISSITTSLDGDAAGISNETDADGNVTHSFDIIGTHSGTLDIDVEDNAGRQAVTVNYGTVESETQTDAQGHITITSSIGSGYFNKANITNSTALLPIDVTSTGSGLKDIDVVVDGTSYNVESFSTDNPDDKVMANTIKNYDLGALLSAAPTDEDELAVTIKATGNTGYAKTAPLNVKYDVVDPVVSALSSNDDTWATGAGKKKVSFKITDEGSGVDSITISRLKSNGDVASSAYTAKSEGSGNYSFMADNAGTYRVDVTDKAGNTSDATAASSKYEVKNVDTVAPMISNVVINPPLTTVTNKPRTVTFHAHDDVVANSGSGLNMSSSVVTIETPAGKATAPSVSCTADGDTGADADCTFQVSGDNLYKVTINDNAGNTSLAESVDIRGIDTTKPQILTIRGQDSTDNTWATSRSVTATYTDEGGSTYVNAEITKTPAGVTAPTAGRCNATTNTCTFTVVKNGSYTLQLQDEAGNKSDEKTFTVGHVDSVTPTIDVTLETATTGKVTESVFRIDTTFGESGIHSLTVYHSKERDGTYTQKEITNLDENLNRYTAIENGYYYFVAKNKANISASSKDTAGGDNIIEIDNIARTELDVKVNLQFENGDPYDEGWTNNNVVVKLDYILPSGSSDDPGDVRYEVNEVGNVDDDGNDIWDSIVGDEVLYDDFTNKNNRYRAVTESGVAGNASQPHTIRIDKETPSTPKMVDPFNYGKNIWHGWLKPADATFTAKDMNKRSGGFKETLYWSNDKGVTWNAGSTFNPADDGTYQLYYKVVDSAGNESDVYRTTLNIDLTTPVVKLQFSRSMGMQFMKEITGGLFFNDTVNAHMEVTNIDDIDSGMNFYEYRLVDTNGKAGKWMKAKDGDFLLKEEFEGTIEARATSNARMPIEDTWQTGKTQQNGFMLEITKPTLRFENIKDEWSHQESLNLYVNDEGRIHSGINAKEEYTYVDILGRKQSLSAGDNLIALSEGEYTIYAQAVDIAGNKQEASQSVKIDRTKPSITAEILDQSKKQKERTVRFQVRDKHSGVSLTPTVSGPQGQVKVNWKDSAGSFTASWNGSYTIKAEDNAGNISTAVFEAKNIGTPDAPAKPDTPVWVPEDPGWSGDLNQDVNGDGVPDINIDIDGDGIPDINIDTDGDGIPDKNIARLNAENNLGLVTITKKGVYFEAGTRLVIEDITATSKDRVKKKIHDVVRVYDIYLELNGKRIDPPCELEIKLNASKLKADNVRVFVKDGSGYREINSDRDETFITYLDDTLGETVLGASLIQPLKNTKSKGFFDQIIDASVVFITHWYWWLWILIAALIYYFYRKYKKDDEQKSAAKLRQEKTMTYVSQKLLKEEKGKGKRKKR